LRRLNPDEVYGETLAGLAASSGGGQDDDGQDDADQAGGQHQDRP
jgi:hypothetical protein